MADNKKSKPEKESKKKTEKEDLEFGEMIRANFGGGETVEISGERLQEMNKKLPEWSLEPPYSFLR